MPIYVDGIIFGSPNIRLCKKFAASMTNNFEISLNADLKFFHGFQIQQFQEGIFLSQAKYLKDILEKFGMSVLVHVRHPCQPQLYSLKTQTVSLSTRLNTDL